MALNDRMTIYTRFGEWFVYLCLIAIIVLVLSATTKTLFELKEIIRKRFFVKEAETVPSAKKVDEYINNNNDDLPSLDDLDELVIKKEIVNKKEALKKTENINKIDKKISEVKKDTKLNTEQKTKKIDLFPEDNSIDYSEIINSSDDYSIFEKDDYTSEISSVLTGIIEENEENSKDSKKNNNFKKGN